jgi:hypothetical protein
MFAVGSVLTNLGALDALQNACTVRMGADAAASRPGRSDL